MSLNRKNLNSIEILAPAGDFLSLKAAINNGANAVYLGLDDFNARVKAENFNKDNIKEVVSYAHLYGVKVYVTVNILIKEEEYPSLIEVLKATVNAKVDAYLVQDLGVARLIRDCFPGAVLHASTQMGVNNLNAALVLQKFGFSRVVLARETKEKDIRLIKEHTSLEIEYFAHGALCVSYSGNCYLSSFNHLQSGNRGRCLQLCRLEYQSNKNKDGYLLSAKDLCLIDDMERLIDAGVMSFKIEGRLRREGYVGLVTKTYSSCLEAIKRRKKFDFNNAHSLLQQAFCRGDFLYGAYLEDGTPDNVIEDKYQNHTGIKCGRLVSCKKFKDIYEIVINTNHQITKGDGLKFILDQKIISSLGVGNFEDLGKNNYRLFSKNFIPNGASVYLILNKRLEDETLENVRRIPLDVYVKAKEGHPLVLSLYYKNHEVSLASEFILPRASKAPISKDDLYNSISKFGTDPFEIANFEASVDDVFAPKSVINDLRRNAVEILKQKIIEINEEENYACIDEDAIQEFLNKKNEIPSIDKKIIIIDEKTSLDDLKQIEDLSSYIVFISLNVYNSNSLRRKIEELKSAHISSIGINVPLINEQDDYVELDKIVDEYPFVYLLASSIGTLHYLEKGIKVVVSPYLNVISSYSKETYLELGVSAVTMSLETPKNILDANKDTYYYALGYNTLMNYVHCPYKTIFKGGCSSCHFDNKLKYQDDKNIYSIRRTKASTCRFELLSTKLLNVLFKEGNKIFVDVRGLSASELELVIESLNTSQSTKITDNDYSGLLFKIVK